MAAIKIESAEQMKALVAAVANDVIHARFYYDLLNGLAAEFKQDPELYNQSPAFWGLTSTSLRDATLIRLTRAYDQQKKALSLVNWLETILENLPLFSESAFRERMVGNPFVESLAKSPRIPQADQLKEDIRSVGTEDQLVSRLIRLRHNASVHVSARSVAEGIDPFHKHALRPEEYDELLTRGKTIVNRYSTLFSASTYSDQLVGADDYVFVLRAVRGHIDELGREAEGVVPSGGHGDAGPDGRCVLTRPSSSHAGSFEVPAPGSGDGSD
jgi:hypothetical protein